MGDPSGRRSARIWLPEGVQVGSCVSEALGAFVASFVGYLGVVLPSRMALFDSESTLQRSDFLVVRFP